MPVARVIKIGRTRQENQERYTYVLVLPILYPCLYSCNVYIAASRRSDRSLTARVESARKASEVYKQRTGHSLRVTEQDVVNEEIYEEEDNDFPVLCRQDTTNLETGSAEFNTRLSTYLTNHNDVRNALEYAVIISYAQQYLYALQFA